MSNIPFNMNNMNMNMNNMNNMNMMNNMPMMNFNMMGNMQGQNMANMAQGMMNNFQNMNMFQGDQQAQPQTNSNYINVHFRAGGQMNQNQDPQANDVVIQTTLEEKLSSIVDKYKNKSGANLEDKKFVYNAKNLNLTLTAAEAGLIDGATIFILNTKNVKGA